VAAAEFARRYPNARIVFSGGTGSPQEELPEAHFAPLAFEQLGVPPGRILYEDRSRNTWENLLYSQRLVKPKRGEVWVLATSASQLPRAMLVASRLHWKLVAWPTGYVTPAGGVVLFSNLDLASNLDEIDAALHEWLGLIAYSVFRPA